MPHPIREHRVRANVLLEAEVVVEARSMRAARRNVENTMMDNDPSFCMTVDLDEYKARFEPTIFYATIIKEGE